MTQKLISVFKYVLLLVVAFALLALAFRGVDVKKTIEEIKGVNLFWLFLSIAVSLVAFLSRAWRWKMLIEPLNYKPKFTSTAYSLMVGYLANLALPRLGEVTRCGSLSKAEKVPFDVLLGTVIAERVIDVISLLICILLVAVFEFDRLGNFLMDNIFNPFKEKIQNIISSPYFIAGSIAAIALLALLFIFLRRKSKESHIAEKILKLINGVVDGLRSIQRLKHPWWFLFHSILIWVMYFFMAYLCFFSLPATSSLDWHAGMFVLVVGGIGMSAPVQGGIGAYHLLVSQGLMLYGLNHEHGLAFATLMHSTQTLLVILLGGISFLLLFLDKKKINNDNA